MVVSQSQGKFLLPPAKQQTALKISTSAPTLEPAKSNDGDNLSQVSVLSPSKQKVNFGDRLFNQRTVSFRTKELTPSGVSKALWEKGLRGDGPQQPPPDINGLLVTLTAERRESLMHSPNPSPLVKQQTNVSPALARQPTILTKLPQVF